MANLRRSLSAREVAETFYNCIEKGDYDLWIQTLSQSNRDILTYGSPWFWWATGRRYSQKYGVRWVFQREVYQDDKRAKLYFIRLNPDGSQRGMPVPIHLIRDVDREWRVETASI